MGVYCPHYPPYWVFTALCPCGGLQIGRHRAHSIRRKWGPSPAKVIRSPLSITGSWSLERAWCRPPANQSRRRRLIRFLYRTNAIVRISRGSKPQFGRGWSQDVRRARLPLAGGGSFGSGAGSNAASNLPSAARSGSRRGARGYRASSIARRIAAVRACRTRRSSPCASRRRPAHSTSATTCSVTRRSGYSGRADGCCSPRTGRGSTGR